MFITDPKKNRSIVGFKHRKLDISEEYAQYESHHFNVHQVSYGRSSCLLPQLLHQHT